MTYKEIKNELSKYRLPNTLQSDYMYYFDLPDTVQKYTQRIDDTISKGINPNKVKQCKLDKKHLIMIIEALKDKSKWNLPKQKLNQFRNKNEM